MQTKWFAFFFDLSIQIDVFYFFTYQMQTDSKLKIFLNTMFWGIVLWIFGYALGILFFSFIPKEYIGWCITPFGIGFTILVLLKWIKRKEFLCYIGLGIIWTSLAIILDYFLLVKPFNINNYYKLDVYIYYGLTLMLPIIVGRYKFKK